jgi:hypothetical protein
MRVSTLVSSLSIFAMLGGCSSSVSVGGQSSMCSEAAAHVADCEGGAPVEVPSCDSAQAQAAEGVVGASCDQIAAGGGKSDGVDAICIALVIPLFARHIAPGGLCCFGYQCEGSANTCISHKCGPRLSAGAKCTANNDCKTGLTCLPSGRCGAPLPAGAACKEKEDCVEPLTCGATHLCVEAAVDGTACTADDQCQHRCIQGSCATASSKGGACDDVSDCSGYLACVGHTCSEMAPGSACDQDGDCVGLGLACQFDKCVPRSKSGESCDPSSFFACDDLHDSCFMDECRPKAELGGACAKLFDCKNGMCRDGICQ